MIRDRDAWEKWEREYQQRAPVNLEANLRLLDAMYEEARALGQFPPPNPLEGIEVDIRIAKVVNVSTAA